MSSSTGSSGQGAPSQPSKPSSLAEFGNSSTCAGHRSPQCAGEQNPRRRRSCQPSPHRKVGEGHRDPRRGESPSARFDCSVEASSGARSRASDWMEFDWILVRISSSVPGSASQLPRRKLPRPSARKVHENSSSSKGWQGWRSCGSRSSRSDLCDGRIRSQSLACNYEKGASVSNGSIGTTDRNSSSSGPVWEDGDVDRRCRCRFESLPAIHPILIGKSRDAAYGLRGVRVGEASHVSGVT